MKPSELMLKGYAMVGKQCRGVSCMGDPFYPTAVCAAGAYNLAKYGRADSPDFLSSRVSLLFQKVTGMWITDANDEGMLIEDIAGILAAEGM